jgi:hypothetical protein
MNNRIKIARMLRSTAHPHHNVVYYKETGKFSSICLPQITEPVPPPIRRDAAASYSKAVSGRTMHERPIPQSQQTAAPRGYRCMGVRIWQDPSDGTPTIPIAMFSPDAPTRLPFAWQPPEKTSPTSPPGDSGFGANARPPQPSRDGPKPHGQAAWPDPESTLDFIRSDWVV